MFKLEFISVESIEVTEPRLVEWDESHWRDGKIVIRFSDGREPFEIPYATEHSKDSAPEMTVISGDDSIKIANELRDLRHKMNVVAEVVEHDMKGTNG